MTNSTSLYKVWRQAVDATEAMLITRGYTSQKAHKLALDRNASLHPAAQKALKARLGAASARNAAHRQMDGATWGVLNGVQS